MFLLVYFFFFFQVVFFQRCSSWWRNRLLLCGGCGVLGALHAELQVVEPLLVLLSLRVDARLAARVELDVAHAAVVLEVGVRERARSPEEKKREHECQGIHLHVVHWLTLGWDKGSGSYGIGRTVAASAVAVVAGPARRGVSSAADCPWAVC